MKVTNTQAIEHTRVKAIVYGPSGHGKTTLAKTIPGKTLIISAESGLLSLAGEDIDVFDISRDDSGELIPLPTDRLRRLREAYEALVKGTKYNTVFIDSLTEISDLLVAMLKLKWPDAKNSMQLWGENLEKMRSIIKDFRDLPKYNVVFTCLSEIDKDENGKRFATFSIKGSMSDLLPQYFDEVFYLAVEKEGVRVLLTQPVDGILCKDRSGALEMKEPADMSVIWSKIFKPKKEGAKQ